MTRHPVEKSRRQYNRWVTTETIEDYALRYLVICVLCWINTKVRSQRRWARLRSAIEKQVLRILFQPQVNMINGQITDAEVLVRWQDPVEG
jgi:sensor c-di-GMP phosphodiesterase-like protein